MPSHSELMSVDGPAGHIDVAVDAPTSACMGLAVVAHPHPLFGGTRDNKVVMTLARTLAGLGYLVLRPDFRGVGASAGSHDEGRGETDDLVMVVQAGLGRPEIAELGPAPRLVLAGFSFGAFVQSRVAVRLTGADIPIERMVLVGTAVARFEVEPVPDNSLLIHGELDETVPLAGVLEWARQGRAPVVVIPGADHFFHRKLVIIKRIVLQAWGQAPDAEEGD